MCTLPNSPFPIFTLFSTMSQVVYGKSMLKLAMGDATADTKEMVRLGLPIELDQHAQPRFLVAPLVSEKLATAGCDENDKENCGQLVDTQKTTGLALCEQRRSVTLPTNAAVSNFLSRAPSSVAGAVVETTEFTEGNGFATQTSHKREKKPKGGRAAATKEKPAPKKKAAPKKWLCVPSKPRRGPSVGNDKSGSDGSSDGDDESGSGSDEEGDSDEEGEILIIDRIEEHTGVKRRKFLVYWEGFPEEPTWEPEGNLRANSVYQEYIANLPPSEPAARKPAARKPAARKPAARKPVAREPARQESTNHSYATRDFSSEVA